MPTPAPEDVWKLLAQSRLVAADVLATLRTEHAGEPAQKRPAASDEAATTEIAKWLVQRGVLTRWQGRRLLNGDSGPFFIGDYRLLERLENEGPGRLFRVRHEPSGRRVCVMLLDRRLCQRVDVWTEIVRRTTIAHETVDPVLSRTWALEQVNGSRLIVCEDVEGVPLADELARLGPLPPVDACRLMLPIFTAVGELHRRGAVHGSLSLDALRREPAAGRDERSGTVRLLQVPLAGDPHAVAAQPPVDATERISGLGRRASFIAPELMLPGRFADERSDVYALGCILHALLTGVPPCWQGDAQRTLSHAAFVGPAPLSPPQVPVEVAALVSYLLARDPAGRYPDAAEAADALATCMGLPPVSGGLPPPRKAAAGAAPLAVPAGAGFDGITIGPPTVAAGSPPRGAAPSPPGRGVADARMRAARLRMLGLAAAVGLASILLGVAVFPRKTPPQDSEQDVDDRPVAIGATSAEKADRSEAVSVEKPPRVGGTGEPGPRFEIVASESLPWASPTDGRPPTLAYLPPGSQLVLLARPADILGDEEGRLFLKALGPRAAVGVDVLAGLCGSSLDEIEQVQAGWQAEEAAGSAAVAGWTVWLQSPSALAGDAALRERAWGKTSEETVDGETIFKGPKLAFWFPSAEEGRVLVISAPQRIAESVSAGQAAPGDDDDDTLRASLPQDLERLVSMLDRSRHLTLLGSPHFLRNDGRGVMAGPLARLIEPLGRFFGDGMHAAAVSLHFGERFYIEVDAISSRAEPAKALAPRLAEGIERVADAVEDAVAAGDTHPYGRKLVLRLPAMIRVVAANARSGAEGTGVVVNAYLPRHAGHNLLLAAELALEQQPGGSAAVAAGARPAATTAVVKNPLEKKISLVFAKDTLEKSIQMVSEEIGMPMEILGGDLQLDGITKNQSFGLDERDKQAGAVLRTILAKSDTAGRLVYVVRSRGGVESIEITTRAAAAKRGDTLPPGFEEQAAQEPAETK